MKIVLAASIYPPEIGGPAVYAASLKAAFERLGHTVEVARLSAYARFPSGIRHLLYGWHVFRISKGAGAIIAFDVHATGLPSLMVAGLRRIAIVVRVGGDFVWEHYVNRTRDLVPLTEFYDHRYRWNLKERCIFLIKCFVIRHALLVCSSRWIATIWKAPYSLRESRVRVIENAIEPKQQSVPPTRKNFIMYGRQIPLKNHEAFRRAFLKAKEVHPEIELEEGIISHDALMEKMHTCYAAAVPSVSEVTPNYVIDALRSGRPFLLTKYSGYAARFGDYGVLIDPLSEEDMTRGIIELASPNTYETLSARVSRFGETRTYDDIAQEFIALLQQ